MYDFDLAKAVARNSQLDPKVFLPMLKRFASLPDKAVARYEVDMKLGRFESALRNLSKVQINSAEEEEKHFDLCLHVVEEHQLHKLALPLFQENKRMHHGILVSLGERLLREQKYQAALSAFLAADPKDLAGAKRAARLCRDWRTFFSCCFEQRLQPNAKESANGASDGAALIKRSVATEVANELSQHTSSMHGVERRDALSGAARILLDYCQDVDSAVDMLISGQLWNEAKRISLLYARSDLDHRCSDAAEVYAETCMQDFDERAEAFEEANKRYLVVLHIVQEQKRSALATGDIVDDKGSVYSAASTLSATSLYSNMSSSSVGTVTSLSSVISASATSTFSLSTHADANKHKSKYNIIGKDQAGRKKKKERKQKMKMKRGSEDELKSLVSTMEQNCVFDYYLTSIAETMFFLSKIGKLSMAKKMFDCFEDMRIRIEISQANRKCNFKLDSEERNTVTSKSRDNDEDFICVGCEKIADSLLCSQLPQELRDFFNYI
jgi:elongator complex protein 1